MAKAHGYDWKFEAFAWESDEGWQGYLSNLYPQPSAGQLLKFKKKWYKKNVDPDFDDTYEPPYAAGSPPGTSSSSSSAPGPAPSTGPFAGGANPFTDSALNDGMRWKKL